MFSRCVDDATAQGTPASCKTAEPLGHPGQGRDLALRDDFAIECFLAIRQAGDLRRVLRPAVNFLDDPRAFHSEAADEALRCDRLAQFRGQLMPALLVQFAGVDDDAVPIEYRAEERRELLLAISIADLRLPIAGSMQGLALHSRQTLHGRQAVVFLQRFRFRSPPARHRARAVSGRPPSRSRGSHSPASSPPRRGRLTSGSLCR